MCIYALLCVHFSFAIILNRRRKLVVLLLLSYRCIVTLKVLRLVRNVPKVGLSFFLWFLVSLEHYTIASALCDCGIS